MTAVWHIVTPEVPPAIGGVADYARALAGGLAAAGDEVHVWCPVVERPAPLDGVRIHPVFAGFGPRALRAAGRALDACPPPRRLLVQWVPHGYGWRGINGVFALWLRRRARRGDRVELVVHEPFLEVRSGPLAHRAAAVVQRAMAAVVLRAASRVWVTVPAWEDRLRPYAPWRGLPLRWVPVPSTIPVVRDPVRTRELREQAGVGASGLLAGHFGSGGAGTTPMLATALTRLARANAGLRLVCIGRCSEERAADLARALPALSDRTLATGPLDAREVSCWLAACDVMLQPYPDGVSARRTSTVSALAHARPVVTTAGRLTEGLWSESQAVRLVPAGDAEAFARAAADVAESAGERLRLGIAGHALYHARFDLHRIVAAIRSPAQP